jgi:hypothetical protein
VIDSTVLDAVTVAKMTAPTGARAPVEDTLLLDGGVLETVKTGDRHRAYPVGSVATIFGDTVPLRVDLGGKLLDQEGKPVPGGSLEYYLFPYLFPQGMGWYFSDMLGFQSFTEYLEYRVRTALSVFTTNRLYVLQMWQLRQASLVAKSVRAVRERYECCALFLKPKAYGGTVQLLIRSCRVTGSARRVHR